MNALVSPLDIQQGVMGAFQQGRAMRAQNETQNALASLVTNPGDTNAMTRLAQFNPQAAMQMQERQAAAAKEQRLTAALTGAQKGDPRALDELFVLAPDMWKRFDDRQRDGIKASTSYMAQSAFQVGRLPEEQRAAAWTQAVRQAEASGMDIPAYLEGYSPQALNQALAVAEKTEAYIKQFEPDWRAVPAGGYLENVNPLSNPNIGQGGQGAVPPPPPGFTLDNGGQTATPSATFSGGFRGISGERVTSTLRSPARNRAVGGAPNSYHLRGQARDSVPPPGMSMAAYAAQLQRLNPDMDVINEGDHVHMEPRG